MNYVLGGIICKDLNANPSNPRLVSRQHHANQSFYVTLVNYEYISMPH